MNPIDSATGPAGRPGRGGRSRGPDLAEAWRNVRVMLENEAPDAEPEGPAPDPDALPPSIPLGELLTRREAGATLVVGVALVVGSFVRYGAGTHAVVGAILGPVLVLLSAIDLRHRLLPNIIVGPAAAVIGVVVAVGEWHHVGRSPRRRRNCRRAFSSSSRS